jgi:hypothetical protein
MHISQQFIVIAHPRVNVSTLVVNIQEKKKLLRPPRGQELKQSILGQHVVYF